MRLGQRGTAQTQRPRPLSWPPPCPAPSALRHGCQNLTVHITVRYVDDCPSWRTVDALLRQVLADAGRHDAEIEYQLVATQEEAEHLGFVGSPTILIDGSDPFGQPGAAAGLACRLYRTPDGLAGQPTRGQLAAALSDQSEVPGQ
jgi:hypothetical protein